MGLSTRRKPLERNTRYSAPALEKGLDVIEALAAEPHRLTLQEIANRLDRSPNELFRMLDVLVRRGYLTREADSTYLLDTEGLRAGPTPSAGRPAARCGDAAHAGAGASDRAIQPFVRPPRRAPGGAGACRAPEPMSCLVRQGAHFAFRDDRVSAASSRLPGKDRRASYLEELAGGRTTSVARRRALLATPRRDRGTWLRGGPERQLSGVIDICFPIFDQFGVVAALNVVYLKQRDARVTVPAARQFLKQAAARSHERSVGGRAPKIQGGDWRWVSGLDPIAGGVQTRIP